MTVPKKKSTYNHARYQAQHKSLGKRPLVWKAMGRSYFVPNLKLWKPPVPKPPEVIYPS